VTGRWRRGIATAMAVGGAAGVVLLMSPGTATAQAPDVAAWWNAANFGSPAPPPPAPPDVKDGDLLVQGSNAVPAALPLSTAPTGSQAVAGLSFTLLPTDIVGALTMRVVPGRRSPPTTTRPASTAYSRVRTSCSPPSRSW
jgi:hypothetical protein